MQEQLNDIKKSQISMSKKMDKLLENEAKRNIENEKRLTTIETRLKFMGIGLIALFGLIFDIVKKKLGL